MVKKLLLVLVVLLCPMVWGEGNLEIAVELTVPDSAWTITIDEVHRVGNELWVVSTVSRDPDVMGAEVISTVRTSLKLDAPALPAKQFIIGKSWGWKNQEPCIFLRQLAQIQGDLKTGELLYRRKLDK